MPERQQGHETDFSAKEKKAGLMAKLKNAVNPPYDPERRAAVKKAAFLVGSTALGLAWANEEGRRSDEARDAKRDAEIADMLSGEHETIIIKEGDTFEGIWKSSGYSETIYFYTWMEAVEKMNPDREFNKDFMLYPTEGLVIPVKTKD